MVQGAVTIGSMYPVRCHHILYVRKNKLKLLLILTYFVHLCSRVLS